MAKELDFDELDKAVTSLMGGVKDPDPGVTEKNLDINATLAPGESPSYNRLHRVAQGIGNETIEKREQTVSLTPAAVPENAVAESSQKRGGRFMDVVHPSSDMRVPTAKKVSREGVTIAPATVTPPADATSSSPDTTVGNLPSSVEPPSELESSENTPPVIETTPQPELSGIVSRDAPTSMPSSTDSAEPSSQPLSSPFLPDAKVEKRPLGGEPNLSTLPPDTPSVVTAPVTVPSPSEVPSLEAHEISAIEAAKPNDEFSKMDAMAEPAQNLEEVNEHIPEEYQNELLAVEKNIAGLSPDTAPVDSEPTPPVSSAPVIASIPKQYQEKPSSGDATNGSIYDTDQYHKPLAHPAKEKSGWTWVIAIIVLILAGAGLGAAAYYFGLV